MKKLKTIVVTLFAIPQIFTAAEEAEGTASKPLDFSAMKKGLVDLDGWEFGFKSRSGRWYGMDSDSSIWFHSDGRLTLTECGYVAISYHGIYTISEEGVITVDLAKYPGKWPRMQIQKRKDGYYLYREDDKIDFEVGGRSGGVETSEMMPFWPFKLTGSSLSISRDEHYEDCKCCGYAAIPDSWDIRYCRVCFWEEDTTIEVNSRENEDWLDIPSKTNFGLTIRQARDNFRRIGASERRVKQFVVSVEGREGFTKANAKTK